MEEEGGEKGLGEWKRQGKGVRGMEEEGGEEGLGEWKKKAGKRG